MLDAIREKLGEEIEVLTRELNVVLPDRIARAVELGDLRENAEYKSALERQQFVEARIGHLARRMSELSKIDLASMPVDRVGFGSRVTVLDVAMGRELELTLTAGDFIDLEAGHVSLESPIGRGLLGVRQGDDVVVQLPAGPRTYSVRAVETLPQQLGIAQ
ncbi:MAG: GreA/GreB family elongation factor [Gammaproteobacteria bacterium]|nr:GreA/GreB family elongation factor [Gammaproteobacteria bacterium]MDE2880899.1 GreA/GreB family elongation factor [Acidobacteriota bacterium]